MPPHPGMTSRNTNEKNGNVENGKAVTAIVPNKSRANSFLKPRFSSNAGSRNGFRLFVGLRHFLSPTQNRPEEKQGIFDKRQKRRDRSSKVFEVSQFLHLVFFLQLFRNFCSNFFFHFFFTLEASDLHLKSSLFDGRPVCVFTKRERGRGGACKNVGVPAP
jgi:hypothetical protein